MNREDKRNRGKDEALVAPRPNLLVVFTVLSAFVVGMLSFGGLNPSTASATTARAASKAATSVAAKKSKKKTPLAPPSVPLVYTPPVLPPPGPGDYQFVMTGAAAAQETVLAYISAKGLSKKEQRSPKCFVKTGGFWNSGYTPGTKNVYWFWDLRSRKICPSAKSPSGWAVAVCGNFAKIRPGDNPPADRIVHGTVRLVRAVGKAKVDTSVSVSVTLKTPCGEMQAMSSAMARGYGKTKAQASGQAVIWASIQASASAAVMVAGRMHCDTPTPGPTVTLTPPPTPGPTVTVTPSPTPTPPVVCPPGSTPDGNGNCVKDGSATVQPTPSVSGTNVRPDPRSIGGACYWEGTAELVDPSMWVWDTTLPGGAWYRCPDGSFGTINRP